MIKRQRVAILSAELSGKSFESNRQRTENLAACLDDCNMVYKRAEGVYKGDSETSFVVKVRNNAELETLKGFAFKNFNQESILETDIKGYSYLEYQNGTVQGIGRLEQVSKEIATKQESFTIMEGKYYVTR